MAQWIKASAEQAWPSVQIHAEWVYPLASNVCYDVYTLTQPWVHIHKNK